jgi:predicted RND superfamily exporter protein
VNLRALGTIATFPARRPWLALAVALVAAGLSVLAVGHLHMDTSLAPLFSRSDPAATAMLRVLDDFSGAEELIVLASLPDEHAAPDPDKLAAFASRLDADIHASPEAKQLVHSVTYRADEQTMDFFEKVLVPTGLFYLDDDAFAQARKRLTRAGMLKELRQDEAMVAAPGPAAQALSKAFLQDPLRLHEFILARLASAAPFKTYQGSREFISPDGRSILIRIRGKRPPSDMEFAKRLTAQVRSIAEHANTGGLTLQYTGSYAIATAAERGIRRDMIITVVGSVVLLQLLFILAYRAPFRLFLLAFGPVAIGVLYGFGVYAGVLTTLTPMTAVIGGILAGMGIDYSIQYIAHYDRARASSLSPRQAASDTTIRVGPAIFAACFTSVIGFLAIGSSDVPAMRDFALLGTLGLAGAFVGALVVLPALLVLSDRRTRGFVPASRLKLDSFLVWLGRWRRTAIVASCIVLALSLAALVGKGELLPLESDLTVMHPRPNPALDAERDLASKFGGSPGSLIVYLHADSPDALLHRACEVQRRLSTNAVRSAGVIGSFGLATLLPDPARTPSRLAAIGPAYAKQVTDDFNAAVARTIFDPATFAPYAEFLNHILTRTSAPGIDSLLAYPSLASTILPSHASAKSPPTESIMLLTMRGDMDERIVRDRAIAAVRSALDGVPGATLTGLSVLAHNTERSIGHELPRLVLIAIGIVLLYLALHFRNLRSALLALVPMVFGLATLLAFMRLADQKLNMINLAALPLLIGIDVDYGIFLVHLARRSWAEGSAFRVQGSGDAGHALAPAVQAVVLCAASTILGFISLVTASVPAVRSLGIAMGLGIFACLVGTLFLLLPLLLVRRDQKRVAADGGVQRVSRV